MQNAESAIYPLHTPLSISAARWSVFTSPFFSTSSCRIAFGVDFIARRAPCALPSDAAATSWSLKSASLSLTRLSTEAVAGERFWGDDREDVPLRSLKDGDRLPRDGDATTMSAGTCKRSLL